MLNVKKMVTAALLCAIGIALPMALHMIPNGGKIFLPMHIPVLLCGLLCGPVYGLLCGALTPLLSSLLTQMPPPAALPAMLCELGVYGLAAALLLHFLPLKRPSAKLYLSLAGAMLAGRCVAGLTNALLFQAGRYTLEAWLASAFVTALPGIVIQLALIPAVVLGLRRAGLLSFIEEKF